MGRRINELGRVTANLRPPRSLGRSAPTADEIDMLRAELADLASTVEDTASELRNEQALSARILANMQEGVLLLDDARRIELLNPALREMLLVRTDVVGNGLMETVRNAELAAVVDKATQESAATGEIEVGGMKPRRLLVRAQRLAEPPYGILCVFVDVTDLRRLESLRKDFVANVSHELRTPVTGVLSGAETLRMALRKSPDDAARFIDIIERNADRLKQLIEDLLDLSRIESRELRLSPEPIRVLPFFEHVHTLFRERADKREMTLRAEGDPGLTIQADRRALEQVIANLLDNAVKYARQGATIRTRVVVRDDLVVLIVADDGPGIDEKHLGRLFERFYRIDGGRARGQGGTGLGLAIAKHLTEALGGDIAVTSKLGSGTTFEVKLPNTTR